MFGKIYSKIAGFFFSDISKFISPHFKELSKTIAYTNIAEDSQTYLSNILFLSFIFGLVLEFFLIFVMLKLNILFNIFTFFLTIVIAFTFAGIIFITLYKYPQYIIASNKKQIENELEITIKHLSVLQDPKLTVKDVLVILQKIEGNEILAAQSKKILYLSDLNNNLKETLKYVCNNTYSEQEYSFFSKLIDVLDNKANLIDVINDYYLSAEQIRKEKEEQQRNRITLLFEINIFLFFLVFILVFSIFLMPTYKSAIRTILLTIAIIFPVIELILIIILNK